MRCCQGLALEALGLRDGFGEPPGWVQPSRRAPPDRVLTGLSWCPGALMERPRLCALGGVQRAGREAAAGLCRQSVI